MISEYLEKYPPTSKSSIERRLEHHALKNCIPRSVTLELGLNCSFKCVHCYNFDRSKSLAEHLKSNPQEKSLNADEIKRIIIEVANEGCFYLSFTGGDPLLHPQFFEFVELARENRLNVIVKTNAVLLDEKRAKRLSQFDIYSTEISLYGASAESHERFTRTKGTFEKTLKGIQNAKKYGLNPILSLILHIWNYQEYAQMVELAKKFKVSYQSGVDISKRHDGSSDSIKYRLDREQMYQLFTQKGGETFIRAKPTDNIQCACARSNCGISSTGEVFPCIGAPLPSGNLREKSFHDIWKNSSTLNGIRDLRSKDFKTCNSCNLRKYCPRNSGTAYMNSGNYTGPDSWACEAASLIKELDQKSDPPRIQKIT